MKIKERYLLKEMPSPKQEEWKYTDLRGLDLRKFNPTTQKIEFVNSAKGVIFTDLNTAKKNYKDILEKYPVINSVKDENKFNLMHKAFLNYGVFIYVPDNTTVELPLRNIFITNKHGGIFSHTVIVLGKNSSLDYVEEHVSTKFSGQALRCDIVEITADQNSQVNFYNFQDWGMNIYNITEWKASLKKYATVNWYFGQFGGKLSRVKIDTYMNGHGSQSLQKGIFFGNKNQHFDITTNIHHLVPNTNGDILVKCVLDESATSVYRGKIKIDKIAQNTNSYLSNHSLILSDMAISNSIPSLEIDANEVRASHGASLGRPDEEELFYLMARGLKRKEAERLIILGFFSPVIDKIVIVDIKEKFEDALRKKVTG